MFENFKVPQELIPSDPRFGVGPSLIPKETVEKLAQTGSKLLGTSHRKEAVIQVVKELQDGIRQYFQLPEGYEILLGNGGATTFWDIMGLGLVEKASLHFTCGEFSEKGYKSHKNIPWISAKEIKVPYGQFAAPVEEDGFDLICASLNETSTGVMMNHLPKLKNPNTLMCIDATSGAGQIKIDFNLVDVYYFSPQKVFASEGGIYVAIFSPKALERAMKILKDPSRFVPESLKLSHAIENSRKHQTYNTPAIASLFFLNEQVKIMNKLGEAEVIKEAKRKADMIYSWAAEKSYLKAFVEDPQIRSQAVATIDIDEKYKAEELTASLRAQGVAIDIDGYRKLGRNQLRIALFHNVKYEDLVKLTKIISLAIESQDN